MNKKNRTIIRSEKDPEIGGFFTISKESCSCRPNQIHICLSYCYTDAVYEVFKDSMFDEDDDVDEALAIEAWNVDTEANKPVFTTHQLSSIRQKINTLYLQEICYCKKGILDEGEVMCDRCLMRSTAKERQTVNCTICNFERAQAAMEACPSCKQKCCKFCSRKVTECPYCRAPRVPALGPTFAQP